MKRIESFWHSSTKLHDFIMQEPGIWWLWEGNKSGYTNNALVCFSTRFFSFSNAFDVQEHLNRIVMDYHQCISQNYEIDAFNNQIFNKVPCVLITALLKISLVPDTASTSDQYLLTCCSHHFRCVKVFVRIFWKKLVLYIQPFRFNEKGYGAKYWYSENHEFEWSQKLLYAICGIRLSVPVLC